ncbi:MAG: methyltransferase protein [Acidobacteria bacterium]|nr:methyltransferase protein [Acidobacteriota bacterium]
MPGTLSCPCYHPGMRPADLYHSARVAAGYARSRPPVHDRIIEAVAQRFEELGIERAGRALDIGCGAGLSTAALVPLAARAVGLEPAREMLTHRAEVAPVAAFVVGRAEELPFRDGVFDLLTAAGALNYTDLPRVLPEAARVLNDEGVFLIYDFSSGRRLAGDARLDLWFTTFERRYPFPPGYELDVKSLDFGAAGLRLVRFEPLQVAVPMDASAYLAYAMSEMNVEQAVAAGIAEAGIASWCEAGLHDIFAAGPRDVLFDGYVAYVRPALPSAA